MTAQATTSLQTQVAALRNNASRMPPPFSDMLRGAAGRVRRQHSASTARTTAAIVCRDQLPGLPADDQQSLSFRACRHQKVALGDFGKLFSPTDHR